jgi:hypothetical protein
MEELKDLKEIVKDFNFKILQIKGIQNRITQQPHMDTKRLLSIAITELQTSVLFLKEAIAEQETKLPERYA